MRIIVHTAQISVYARKKIANPASTSHALRMQWPWHGYLWMIWPLDMYFYNPTKRYTFNVWYVNIRIRQRRITTLIATARVLIVPINTYVMIPIVQRVSTSHSHLIQRLGAGAQRISFHHETFSKVRKQNASSIVMPVIPNLNPNSITYWLDTGAHSVRTKRKQRWYNSWENTIRTVRRNFGLTGVAFLAPRMSCPLTLDLLMKRYSLN